MHGSILDKIERRLKPEREHLLIVDDEEPLLELYCSFFESRGYGVAAATTLAMAQAKLTEEKFDLVLLDVLLPDGSGIDFLARIKTMQPAVPVIVLSGLGYDEETLQNALKKGASDYVSKQLPLDQLLMEVHQVLKASLKS